MPPFFALIFNRKFRIRQDIDHPFLSLENLTVIVPFRNEAKRILGLLNSLDVNEKIPRLLFIDDHSDDGTDSIIRNAGLNNTEVLKLTNTSGKKSAIQLGVQTAESDYILTLDAEY